jgi:hypothetical protein
MESYAIGGTLMLQILISYNSNNNMVDIQLVKWEQYYCSYVRVLELCRGTDLGKICDFC